MGKSQKQVSFSRVWMDEIKAYYDENEVALKKINICSVTELLRVLANLGREPLDKILENLKTETPT